MSSPSPPPLTGLRVLELSGLAPGPFTGLLLSDFGAQVLRIDQPSPTAPPDLLTRRKSSIALSLKSPNGSALFRTLITKSDILIDPYRPGVLEKLGFSPANLLSLNPRLIIARLTGFRRDGPYEQMAGHDINYIALSGVLALLGRSHEKPYAPGNLLGDFAAGGMTCFLGILLALIQRNVSGCGQIVEANMVDGSAYLATFIRYAMQTPGWNQPRGENVLDGGCPWYDTYETSDGRYMAVGCLEERFYRVFVERMGFKEGELPERMERGNWEMLRKIFGETFRTKTRREWEGVFEGCDACVTPVLSFGEVKERGGALRPVVDLSGSPGLAMSAEMDGVDSSKMGLESVGYRRGQGDGVEGDGFEARPLVPGTGGEEVLREWLGFEKGRQYDVSDDGGFELRGGEGKAKL